MSMVFEVVVADGVVIGSSDRRLPFEPKGSAVEYRRQLREAVSTLQARSGEVLNAVYDSASVDRAPGQIPARACQLILGATGARANAWPWTNFPDQQR